MSPAFTQIRPEIDEHRTRDCRVRQNCVALLPMVPGNSAWTKLIVVLAAPLAPAAPHRLSVQQWWRAGRTGSWARSTALIVAVQLLVLEILGRRKDRVREFPARGGAVGNTRRYGLTWSCRAMPALRQSVAFGIKSDSLPRLLREPRMVPSGRPFQRSCVPGRPTIFPNRGRHVYRTRAAPGGRPGQSAQRRLSG